MVKIPLLIGSNPKFRRLTLAGLPMGHAWHNIVEPKSSKSIASNGLGNPLQMGEFSIGSIDYRRVNPSAPRGEVIPDMASMSDLWVHGENQRTEVPTKAATGS